MIKIQSITMREIRGIRELTFDLRENSFVISGPNGSGKSGVIDAIEFCLTGDISRLSGKGTGGITTQRHGPHVDRRDDPESAEVVLTVHLVDLDKTATLSRNMKKPKVLTVEPDEPDIRETLEEVASHPELVLSRREIIKFVVTEAGERSKEVQALLRLDRIGQIRSTLRTAQNKLKAAQKNAEQDLANAVDDLERHLEVESASPENILASVNERRALLGLKAIEKLTEHSALDGGVEKGGADASFNKESALRDIKALISNLVDDGSRMQADVDAVLGDLGTIESDSALLTLVQRASFIEQGLSFVESEFCPLCDTEWTDMETLRAHLEGKLEKSEAATKIRSSLLNNAGKIAAGAKKLASLVESVATLAEAERESVPELPEAITTWSEGLAAVASDLGSVDGILGTKERLVADWREIPEGMTRQLEALASAIEDKPDQSATVSAQTFLTRAQDRYVKYRLARQASERSKTAAAAGKKAYETYCSVAEDSLRSMYNAVEEDFSTFYQELNAGDESGFKARFEQGEGKLDLSVDFYGVGMFPPGAYHSEGHQDGMGVCLYLALMQRLLGERFRFAVLDDVVMSVDRGHRKQFCRILRKHFPDTQFVITTHDPIWARQMRSEGLVTQKSSVEFYGWSLETGPIFEPVSEVWDRIDEDLGKNDVPSAAARLRRHLEFTSGELAHELEAKVPYKGDGAYDLGELFSAVVSRQQELLGKAAEAANSWNDEESVETVRAMKAARSKALGEYGGEQWIVNKAVHYNEWADFSQQDFVPVVEAARALLDQFRCLGDECGGWLYPIPQRDPETLRCRCGAVSLNLTTK